MPDASGNYLGDYAGVLPDLSAQVMHMADQYAAINKSKLALQLAQKKLDDKRNADYYKLVDTNFDLTKYNDLNPYHDKTVEDLSSTKQKYYSIISNANQSGKPIDQGQLQIAMANDLNRIKTNDDWAKQRNAEINDGVKLLEKEPGIDFGKLTGLAKQELFGDMDSKKWDRNVTGADMVQRMLDKYPAIIGDGKGVNEQIRDVMNKSQATETKLPGVLDKNGIEISPGITVKIKPFQQEVKDKNGNTIGLDIRQEPVVASDGTPITNTDGTQRTTIAPDLEKDAMNNIGFKMQVITERDNAIGEENQRRRAINDNMLKRGLSPSLTMITPDSEEAKLIQSDIVLDRYKKLNQGGAVDIAANKDFEHRIRKLSLDRLVNNDAKKEAKDAAKDAAIANIESPLDKIAREQGEVTKIKDIFFGEQPKTIVYVDKIDPKEYKLIQGKSGKDNSTAPAGATLRNQLSQTDNDAVQPFKDSNGREYFEVGADGNWQGKNGLYDKEVTKNAAIKSFADKDLLLTSYNKKSATKEVKPPVEKKGVIQKAIDSIKSAAGTSWRTRAKKIK